MTALLVDLTFKLKLLIWESVKSTDLTGRQISRTPLSHILRQSKSTTRRVRRSQTSFRWVVALL
jgi:hypothetical protein